MYGLSHVYITSPSCRNLFKVHSNTMIQRNQKLISNIMSLSILDLIITQEQKLLLTKCVWPQWCNGQDFTDFNDLTKEDFLHTEQEPPHTTTDNAPKTSTSSNEVVKFRAWDADSWQLEKIFQRCVALGKLVWSLLFRSIFMHFVPQRSFFCNASQCNTYMDLCLTSCTKEPRARKVSIEIRYAYKAWLEPKMYAASALLHHTKWTQKPIHSPPRLTCFDSKLII